MDAAVPTARHFHDADAARACLEAQRWPESVVCPHCGASGEATKLQPRQNAGSHARRGLYQCNKCREQFTVTVGTIFQDSHVPLNKWLTAIHLLCTSADGMTAQQLHRTLLVTYKTAWLMTQRIRQAAQDLSQTNSSKRLSLAPLTFDEAVRSLLKSAPSQARAKDPAYDGVDDLVTLMRQKRVVTPGSSHPGS